MAYPARRTAIVYLTNSFFGLGVAPELVARSIGGQPLGSIALNYRQYDWPVYRAGWAWAEKDPETAGGTAALVARFPEAFSKEGIEFLSAMYEEADRLADFAAPLEYYVQAHPRSGQAQLTLARALMQSRDWPRARTHLQAAGRSKEDKAPPAVVKWNLEFIRAVTGPKALKESHLRKIAGSYGPRQIEFREGRLYYFRKGGSSPDFRPLVAMSKDTFILEANSAFRLKIEFDKKGNPTKALGIYWDGRRDETARDE